jgi:hypothetical protein
MPSSPCILIGHPSHPSHLGYLGNIGNLNTLNPYLPDPTPTDSYHRAFVIEMDPNDPGPLEGYFIDNLLNPLPIETPLLPYISQAASSGHSLDIPLDALDRHGSLMGVEDT